MPTELFEPRNRVAVRHGAHADLGNTQEVLAATDAFIEQSPHLAAFRSLAISWVDLETRCARLRVYLDGLDPGDKKYKPAADLLLRFEHRSGVRRGELGLSPRAAAEIQRLLLDVEAGHASLADLAAAGRSTVPRIGHTEPAAVEAVDNP